MFKDFLHFNNRKEFYDYLSINHNKINEVYIEIKIGDPSKIKNCISYIDSVEVALCFGWIDSTKKKIGNKLIQRFSKRKKNSSFTELNKERCRRLIKLKDMTKFGLEVIPNLDEYKPPKYLIKMIENKKDAYEFFKTTPKLYQNIKLSTLDTYHKKDKKVFKKSFSFFIDKCEKHMIYGSFDDFGRLSNY